MIKRVLGWLFTLVALAVVAFAVLNRGNYTSMCFDKTESVVNEIEEPVDELPDDAVDAVDDMEAVVEADVAADAPIIEADTTNVQ
jgi:hypothetical protein